MAQIVHILSPILNKLQSKRKIISNNSIYKISFAIIFLVIPKSIFSQNVYNYNLPNTNCYSEMIFEETVKNPKGIIVIDVMDEDIKTYSKDNKYLNSGLFLNYNIFYVKTLFKGSSSQLSCYDVLINTISYAHKINKKVFYVFQEQVETSNSEYPFYFITVNNESNLQKIVSDLDSKSFNNEYKLFIYDSETAYNFQRKNYKNNLDVGLFYSPVYLTGNMLNLSDDNFGSYGLTLKKNIGQKTAISLKLGMSINTPDEETIKTKLQSQVQSSAQSGGGKVRINEILSGHIYFESEFSFRYYLKKAKPFREFLSIGIGYQSVTSILGKIDKTVDTSNISNLQSELSSGINVTMLKSNYLTPLVEIGFDYRISPVTKFSMSLPFRYYINQTDKDFNTFSHGLNFGISFTFNPSKISTSKKK
jgi:hypothetical protein